MNPARLITLLLLWPLSHLTLGQTAFNADSVYAHIRYLAEEIGPRPMGSAQERRALEWAAGKFRTYGADTAWVMPFTRVEDKEMNYNTRSGVAVGIFYGTSDTSLAVGGHADTQPDESPGANDNASGTATAIELARLWSGRPRHYTMIFLSFGGEEMGLYGSTWFVKQFDRIDRVGLMISADMTGGSGEIITIMENRKAQAPRWLVQDALRINREMGISPLRYPTHFATFNSLIGGAGSDHDPFLAAGIPAMDFTTGINSSPIHTAHDNLANIDRNQLDQCGRFIDALLAYYQSHGLPDRKLDHYTLWSPFGIHLFIPRWILVLALIIIGAVSMLAYWRSRQEYIRPEKSQRIRYSMAKLALLFLVVAGTAQMGEGVIQAFTGVRYPWLVPVMPYLLLMLVWAIGGLWFALQIGRRWRWSREPHVYASRALIVLAFLTAAASFASARLALYPGLSLLCISLALLVRRQGLKFLLVAMAPLPLLRLIFSELTEFMARNLALGGMVIDNIFKAALYTALLTLLLLAVFLPFIGAGGWLIWRLPWLRRGLKSFSRWPAGVGVAVVLAVAALAASRLPSHDARWRPAVRLEAKYELPGGKNEVVLRGDEYFQEVRVRGDSLDLHFSGGTHKEKLPLDFKADWIGIAGSEFRKVGQPQTEVEQSAAADSGAALDSVAVDWLLASTEPWQSVTVSIRSDTLKIASVESELKYQLTKEEALFSWRSQPPDSLRLQARLLVPRGAQLIRKVTANYNQPPLPLEVSSPLAQISYRTRVILTDTLTAGSPIDRP